MCGSCRRSRRLRAEVHLRRRTRGFRGLEVRWVLLVAGKSRIQTVWELQHVSVVILQRVVIPLALKVAPTAPLQCPQTPSLPVAHIPSLSPPGSESNPRAVAGRYPPATTPPSPPDPSPPTDCALRRTVQTAPARSPPAPPIQSSPCSYPSPEYKIFLPV